MFRTIAAALLLLASVQPVNAVTLTNCSNPPLGVDLYEIHVKCAWGYSSAAPCQVNSCWVPSVTGRFTGYHELGTQTCQTNTAPHGYYIPCGNAGYDY